MQLRTLYIRFYKSFNHDYLRRIDHRAIHNDWDYVDGKVFPFIEIPLDSQITTVVGANESGKSHLLDAIERGISGANIKRRDFCRNSELFTSVEGELRLPDFGFEWILKTDSEQTRVANILQYKGALSRFFFFRINGEPFVFYPPEAQLPNEEDEREVKLSETQDKNLVSLMPSVFRLKADVALPDRVSLRELVKGRTDVEGRDPFMGEQRGRRVDEALEKVSNQSGIFADLSTITNYAPTVISILKELTDALKTTPEGLLAEQQQREEQAFNLAWDLLCRVARIDRKHLSDLDEALLNKGKDDGYAQSIVENINARLDATFNFSNIWAQDREFKLAVAAGRDNNLTFTIQDRTGRNYSFVERSAGLKYFLSYYIQYLSHPNASGDEILLMDEPDTYLSSRAQSDLLKIFDKFASPEVNSGITNRKPVQVIYVTHSPFLIDKNFAYRVRVLEKGAQLEGTRVVKDASIRHYEPLRTAFNGFYGETAYIGSCNLIVEGSGDQIIIAGAASLLNRYEKSEIESLNLNNITIVPCEGCGNMPFMVIQARGRDLVASPPLIVLLDSDKAGIEALKQLSRGKSNVDKKLILQVGDLNDKETTGDSPQRFLSATGHPPLEIEDVIPLAICVQAARLYCLEICDASREVCLSITEKLIAKHFEPEVSFWDALKKVLATKKSKDFPNGLHMEKSGFARYVIDVVSYLAARKYKQPVSAAETSAQFLLVQSDEEAPLESALIQFEVNMKILFRELGQRQRLAESQRNNARISEQVDQERKAFIKNWPETASREQLRILFEKIENKLTDNDESDEVRKGINSLRRRYVINSDGILSGEQYEAFKNELEAIRYAGVYAAQGESLEKPLKAPETVKASPAQVSEEQASSTSLDLEMPTAPDSTGVIPIEGPKMNILE